MSLRCEECTKTKNHCCKADIPLGLLDALHMKYLLVDKYKVLPKEDVLLNQHPNEQPGMYFVLNIHDITPGSEVDIRDHNCAALIDGKCAVYADRPNICRQYGTDFMKCRFDCEDTPVDIGALEFEDIKILDTKAFNTSLSRDIRPLDV